MDARRQLSNVVLPDRVQRRRGSPSKNTSDIRPTRSPPTSTATSVRPAAGAGRPGRVAQGHGSAAMLDALAYLKAARATGAPAALEVSRSGLGAHVWQFFTAPVPAATARQVGSGLLREAIAVRGRMDLASYDRLFPSQDV